ncbi:MAG: hypothetical protein ACM3SW_05205 [Actinomycetota bacterium]
MAKTPSFKLKEISDPKYKPGQVWTYRTRPGEVNSTVTVLRIESVGDKTIVHIRVDNIRLRSCLGGPEPDKFEHMPFAREAFDQSVVKLLKSVDVPDYKEGYSEWRKAWDAGKAGFYTISIAQALDVAQATFDQGLGCPKERDSRR